MNQVTQGPQDDEDAILDEVIKKVSKKTLVPT